jgi:PAS domain S-box-containing protein
VEAAIILISFSMLIRIATFAVVMTYVNASNRRIAWVFIAAAMLLMAMENVFQLLYFAGISDLAFGSFIPPLAGFIVSVLLLTGTLLIRAILKRLRKAERIHRLLDNRYRILFNSSSDQIFVLNMKGKIVEANQSACEHLGYSREDLLTKHFSDIHAETAAASITEHIENLRRSETLIFESEHLSNKGRRMPVEISCRRVMIEDEPYITCVSRNIADRKEVEKKIMTAIIETEETERSRFAKEIHDGLGPLLSAIKLYVNELEGHEYSDAEKSEYISMINTMIDEAVDSSRNIANNITPKLITDYGLVKALKSYCNTINATNILRIDFKSPPEFSPETTLSLTLYRIITELINNTIKHAQASHVKVVLQHLNNKIQLDYSDNGIGFDLEKALEKSDDRMGVKNIISRVRSINGVFNFQNTKPGILINIQFDYQ